ncbi:hypothetical protein GC197_04230 [bacterium]|nr:hypothetical protein [bacterium]
MALRMHLYGCNLATIRETFESGNAELLLAAQRRVISIYGNAELCARANAWLRALIEEGYSLSFDRTADAPDSEAHPHAAAINGLVKTLAQPSWLDLSRDSSQWDQAAMEAFMNDVRGLKFESSAIPVYSKKFFPVTIAKLSGGTALFSDRFNYRWGYYCFLEHAELGLLLAALADVKTYKGELPDLPSTRISKESERLIDAMIGLFQQIQQANQDAYVLWS